MIGVRQLIFKIIFGGAEVDSEFSLRELEKTIWPGRFALASVVFLGYFIGSPGREIFPLGVVAGAYIAAYVLLRTAKIGCPAFSTLLVVLDVAAISVAVGLSGGAASVFALLYAFPVVVIAILRGVWSGAGLATVAALFYLLASGAGRLLVSGEAHAVALLALIYGLAALAGVVHNRIQRDQLDLSASLIQLHRGIASFMDGKSIAYVLKRGLELGVEATGASQGAVAIWSEDRQWLHLYTLGLEQEAAAAIFAAQDAIPRNGRFAPYRLSRSGQPAGTAKAPFDSLYVPMPELGEWQGAFCFTDPVGKPGFSLRNGQIARLLAVRIATAVTHQRAIEERLLVHDRLLQILVAISDSRERAPAGHSERVSRFARLIGETLGLAGEELEQVAVAGLLHDIGKIGVADEILAKPGVLDDDQRAIIMTHSQIAEAIVARAGPLARVSPILRGHHERWDGRGYPDGLAREEIPLGARIVAVADSLESMLIDRPHRVRMSMVAALGEIQRRSGTQFDPAVAAASLKVVAETDGASSKSGSVAAKVTLPEVNAMAQSARWRLFTQLASEIDILLDLPELGDRLLDLLCGELEVSGASLFVMESDPVLLRVVARHGPAVFLHLGDALSPGQGIPWIAVEGGETLTVSDVSTHPNYLGIGDAPARAAVYVPLRSTSGIRGVIVLYRELGHTFDQHEMAYLDALAVPIAELITISELHARASKAAITDSLTGASSRSFGFERLRIACANSERTQTVCAVVMLDLDGFKEVNDQYGHRTGDEVLRVSVGSLKSQLRSGDTLARYGGDEFMMILEDTAEIDVMALVDRISRSGHGLAAAVDGVAVNVPSWSAGFAIYPDDGQEPDDLVRVADARLYTVKNSRRPGKIDGPVE